MKRVLLGLIFIALGFVGWSQKIPDSLRLDIKKHYGREAVTVIRLLDAYHYRDIEFDDSLSNVVLSGYVKSLDNGKMYFYKDDIEIFHKYYENKLDELINDGDLNPAFMIYRVFENRFAERLEYVRDVLIDQEYDFTLDEYFETNREDAPWPSSKDEMNDVWRKQVKSQVLNLKLAGKTKDEIKDSILKRYENMEKSVHQYRNDDIFQLFMNEIAIAYDPHTNYFSPTISERFRQNMSLSLEGIGARLVSENDFTKVVEIIPGGPAYKSKALGVNDRIVGVAQGKKGKVVDVVGWRLDDVVKLIKGPKGTWVTLEVLPAATGLEGPRVQLQLQREKIKLEDQAATKEIVPYASNGKTYKMGVISIPSFYMDFEAYQRKDPNYNSTTRDVKRLISELSEENIDGLVIDLRDNGGGSLMEAIDLTGLFIKDGPVVQIRNIEDQVEVGEDEDESIDWDGPLTVLINRFSASASEIFSAAIQDYQRGVVIGEQSYGKGTVQSMVDLKRFIPREKEELGQLKLTLQKFYRINGSSTQHKGVTPDIEFPSAFDASEFGESSEPSALPWDQIKSTNYRKLSDVDPKLLASIHDSFNSRLQSEQYLIDYARNVEELRKSIHDTRVSLNEDIRKKEMEQNEQKTAERQQMNTRIDLEGTPSESQVTIQDEVIREAVIILSELVASKVG